MCLALPGQVIKISNNQAVVDFGDHQHKVKCDLTKDVKVGDYVYEHAGYILEKVSAQEAKKILKLIKEE